MFYLNMVLVIIYICIALRLYWIYIPQCNGAIVTNTIYHQIIKSILALCWLPILLLSFIGLAIAIAIIAFTDNDLIHSIDKYMKRKK